MNSHDAAFFWGLPFSFATIRLVRVIAFTSVNFRKLIWCFNVPLKTKYPQRKTLPHKALCNDDDSTDVAGMEWEILEFASRFLNSLRPLVQYTYT